MLDALAAANAARMATAPVGSVATAVTLAGGAFPGTAPAGWITPAALASGTVTAVQAGLATGAALAPVAAGVATLVAAPAPESAVQVDAAGRVLLAPAGLDAVMVEANINARQALSPILAASAGVITGAGASSGTGSVIVQAPQVGPLPGAQRIQATFQSGSRTATILTLPT